MIFRDGVGFLSDRTNDCMDSSVRAGIKTLFDSDEPLEKYITPDGLLMRGPSQRRSSNPWNTTRDQLLPFSAGLWKSKRYDLARQLFISHAKRFFFCQNLERDEHGSTKAPWPHRFVDDNGQWTTRSFDGPDPLSPHHIWHLSLCCRSLWSYPLFIVGAPCLMLAIIFNNRDLKAEQNQLISQIVVAGSFWIWIYKKLNPSWALQTRYYWDVRRESEYADMIIRGLNGKNSN